LGDGTFSSTNKLEPVLASNVVAVAAGGNHSLLLKSDGSLWAMGDNSYGQLGDGAFNPTNRPEQIVSGGVVAISAGVSHSLFVKSDGSLWGMGADYDGQLGDGRTSSTNRPEQIVSSGVVAVVAGAWHSLFIKSDGSLWAMGRRDWGQLGDGLVYPSYTNNPERIVLSGVSAVAGGYYHSLFLKSDGSLWAMGAATVGQLGNGMTNSYMPVPTRILSNNVVAIAAGDDYSLFVKTDGSLWGTGLNEYGQLGDGTSGPNNLARMPEQIVPSGVAAIAAGQEHSLFLKANGTLWAMGRFIYGQLGDGFFGGASAEQQTLALPEPVFPSPQPSLTLTIASGTNLQLNATCQFGGGFRLLASTNLAQPLSQWVPVSTNSVTVRGTNNFGVTLTNEVSSALRRFYILRSP
jgi:alpha-tubulin suppressor-like RCC1 family protein